MCCYSLLHSCDADNQSDLTTSQTDQDDDDQCRFQDMEMSATINPGIVHFLGANLARWADAVKKHLDVTIEVIGSGSARVIGDFKNIMSFEKYLQTQFPKDPDVISE
ncbi:hypothetical protein MAR_015251 [Mya arenaria]|uniref:Uncharacterized protein n=1 Tax=Mya arenaria TaxID=6604 RepID=A0ABY7FGN7_MYAAR|nr:hypothetical protein MAR_015251 [Mya arenaria]